jgi:hypothetical protein
MTVLLTGVDDDGRSCVVGEIALRDEPFESSDVTFAVAAKTESCPPQIGPHGRGTFFFDHGVAPGIVEWVFSSFPPEAKTIVHHTDSVDFVVVLEGSVDVVLDDGPHRLNLGDGIIMNGVDHSWQTHQEPCRTSVCMIAAVPRNHER